jgi:CRP-like cAMP-binding protein
MTVQAATEKLKDVGVFKGLSAAEIQTLLEGAERREVPAGVAIFNEGDDVSGIFVIESGKVVVRKATGGGKQHDLATLEAKAVFGEMGLLKGGDKRTASVVASESTVIWQVPRDRFTGLLEHGTPAASKVLLNIARVLATRLDVVNNELLKVIELKGEKKKTAELAAFKEQLYKEWAF